MEKITPVLISFMKESAPSWLRILQRLILYRSMYDNAHTRCNQSREHEIKKNYLFLEKYTEFRESLSIRVSSSKMEQERAARDIALFFPRLLACTRASVSRCCARSLAYSSTHVCTRATHARKNAHPGTYGGRARTHAVRDSINKCVRCSL